MELSFKALGVTFDATIELDIEHEPAIFQLRCTEHDATFLLSTILADTILDAAQAAYHEAMLPCREEQAFMKQEERMCTS